MKTLILATDFSDAARNAAEYGASLTSQIPSVSRLILYHGCFDQISIDVPLTDEQYYRDLKEESMRRLNELKCRLIPFAASGVTIECVVNVSSLQAAICGSLLKENPGLIVMGTTGKSKVKERIFGSQAVMAARQTTVPLLLVPLHATYRKVKRVVLAWDMKDSEKTFPAQFLKDFLKTLNAELSVVNIDHNNRKFSAETIGEQSFMHDLLDADNVQYYYDNSRDVDGAVMAFAEHNRADWIIVIPKKQRLFENLLEPSMTHKLTFHSKIAVLILPPKK